MLLCQHSQCAQTEVATGAVKVLRAEEQAVYIHEAAGHHKHGRKWQPDCVQTPEYDANEH